MRRKCIAYPPLAAGERFDTKYGVVEVIKDDRATSTVELPNNLQAELKRYSSVVSKQQVQVKKHFGNLASSSLAKRKLLTRLYVEGVCTPESVFDAYFGVDPRTMTRFRKTPPIPSALANPSSPEGSNPDRIVECFLIPDRRPRCLGLHDKDSLPELAVATPRPTKLFLQRRLLTSSYTEDSSRFYCPRCLQCYVSRTGYMHHEKNIDCEQKREAEQHGRQAALKLQESRALAAVAKHDSRDGQNEPVAMDDIINNTTNILNEKTGKKLKIKKIKREDEEVVHPDRLLADLEAELHRVQASMLGPVYPEVWQALGYGKPRKKSKKRHKKKHKAEAKLLKQTSTLTSQLLQSQYHQPWMGNQQTTEALVVEPHASAQLKEPDQPYTIATDNASKEIGSIVDEWIAKLPVKPVVFLPEAPLIDSRALVAEVDSGRYPSFKRFEGVHEELCTLCRKKETPSTTKRKGVLLPCSFCKRAVHLNCVLKRYTLKEPEPEDEFMCHFCISTILHRRKRAEKRRLEKLEIKPLTSDEIKAKNAEQVELVAGSNPEKRTESISAQLVRIDEVSTILADCKTRLSQGISIAKANEPILSLVADFEQSAVVE